MEPNTQPLRYPSPREYLEAARIAKAEAARYRDRVAELESRCAKMTSVVSDMPKGGHSDQELLWATLADEREYLTRAEIEESRVRLSVERLIGRLQSPVERAILRRRYLDGFGWDAVQKSLERGGLYYSDRQIYRYHGRALRELRQLMQEGSDDEV